MWHTETLRVGSVALESLSCEANPFCTRFIKPGALPFVFTHLSPQLQALHLESLTDQIVQAPLAVIVGPHGTGKSTLIESLMPGLMDRFRGVAHLQLHAPESIALTDRLLHARKNAQRARKVVSSASAGTLIIIDGIEQLSPLDRWRLRCSARRKNHCILATSHHSLAGFQRVWTTAVDRSLVEYLSQRLLKDSSRRTTHIVLEAIRDREITSGTNLRNLWFELYDIVAARA